MCEKGSKTKKIDGDTLTACATAFRAWADDPLNRLSLEAGAYGDEAELVRLFSTEFAKAATSRHLKTS